MPEQHVWIDGPEGPSRHCPVCGASRSEDYANLSCADILRERGQMKPYLLDVFTEREQLNWERWLKAQKEPQIVTMTRGEWYAKRFIEFCRGIWIYKHIP